MDEEIDNFTKENRLFLLKKLYAERWAAHFDDYTTIGMYMVIPKVYSLIENYVQDEDQILFLMAAFQFLMLAVGATVLYRIHIYLPLVTYVYLFVTAKGNATIYAILATYWILTKLFYRERKPEEQVKKSDGIYNPYDFRYVAQQVTDVIKPLSKKEHDIFLQCIPLIELAIMFAAGAAIVLSGNKSCFPLLAVIVVVVIARSVPSVGGNSTAGVITILMIFVFSVMMVGPHMYVQWAEALGWEMVPEKIQTPVVTEDIATQGWLIWDTITDSLFQRVGLSLNYTKLSDVLRCFLGLYALAYLLVDEWFGPGESIMSMITVKLKSIENKQFCLLGMFKSLNWLGLIAELGFCFITGNYTKMLLGLLAIVAASCTWFFLGRYVWRGRGMVASQIEARTDTMMIFGDGPTGARIFVCRVIAVMTLVAYFMQNGAANGFGLLLLLMIPAMTSERMLALFIGFVTANVTMVTMGLLGKKPINAILMESAQPAADPTYGGNSGSGESDEEEFIAKKKKG